MFWHHVWVAMFVAVCLLVGGFAMFHVLRVGASTIIVTPGGRSGTIFASAQITEMVFLPVVVSAPTATPTPTATPGVFDPEEEILIPVGSFQMGCDSNNLAEECQYDGEGDSDEQPLHTVYLEAYFIDKYEVTNARYQECVDAGGCTAPGSSSSDTRPSYYGNPTYADYPVINVTWFHANTFCRWSGKRLPTEAEWEKAARGSSDTRKYPWGNHAPNCTLLNYAGCMGDTNRVGSHPSGASPYGAMDMAGNVFEWVNDLYSSSYYSVSPPYNPLGPATGLSFVLRGGAWYNGGTVVRAAYRGYYFPESWGRFGFRCARDQ